VLAISCAAFSVAAWSTTRRKRLGYYFCLLFSIAMLPSVPVGTILGWNMLRALRKNRGQFWRHTPRPPWMRHPNRLGT
jgi:predicted alpha/beta hydrolase